MNKLSEPDTSLKMTLIERLGQSFDALIMREFGKRFYAPEFLHELVDKKGNVDAEMGKSMGLTLLLASIITFFDLISGKLNIGPGLSVDLSKDISPILSFLTASALLRTTLLMIDLQIVNQVLIRLGSSINVTHFNLIFINRKPVGHWSDAMVPTYFGAISGKAQHVIFGVMGLLMAGFSLLMIAFPTAAIINSAIDTHYSDTRILGKLISYASVFLLILIYFLIGCFLLKYQFLRADFDEVTREPTEHFRQEMEERFAQENSSNPPRPSAENPG